MLKVESIPDNFLIDSGGSIVAENTDIRKILSKIPLIISNTKYAD